MWPSAPDGSAHHAVFHLRHGLEQGQHLGVPDRGRALACRGEKPRYVGEGPPSTADQCEVHA